MTEPDLRKRLVAALDGLPSEFIHPNEFGGYDVDNGAAADIMLAVVEPELAGLRAERDRASRDYREMGRERDDRQMKVEELRREIDRLRDTHDWMSEACRLTVADAAIVRDQRGRLHRDVVSARAKLIELIGGGWTVEPSLTDLATYAARFWGDDRRDLAALRAEVSRLQAEGTGNTIPDDAADMVRLPANLDHACWSCRNAGIQYQPFSGGKEYYCPTCEDVFPYREGQAPRRVQMIADGRLGELRAEMEERLACTGLLQCPATDHQPKCNSQLSDAVRQRAEAAADARLQDEFRPHITGSPLSADDHALIRQATALPATEHVAHLVDDDEIGDDPSLTALRPPLATTKQVRIPADETAARATPNPETPNPEEPGDHE